MRAMEPLTKPRWRFHVKPHPAHAALGHHWLATNALVFNFFEPARALNN